MTEIIARQDATIARVRSRKLPLARLFFSISLLESRCELGRTEDWAIMSELGDEIQDQQVFTQETVASYLARFFKEKNIQHVFAMSGGAALHIIHAFASHNVSCVALNHEQTVGFAADGYARATDSPSVAIATSGPGATNLVTAIAGAYYDSVPVVFITGQVSRSRRLQISGLRQYGFQETPFTEIVRPICKKAYLLDDPTDTKNVVEDAFLTAQQGRPGPVVIDVPDDVQREFIDNYKLAVKEPPDIPADAECSGGVNQTVSLMLKAKRPVLIAGSGVFNSNASNALVKFAKSLDLPLVQTWGTAGLVNSSDTNAYGYFGTHGSRLANFVVQNSDLVISLGCRLDTKATGSPPSSFARDATKVVVDIDQSEIDKLSVIGLTDFIAVRSRVDTFLNLLAEAMPSSWKCPDEWRVYTQGLRSNLSIESLEGMPRTGPNPYGIFRMIGERLDNDALVVLDTGLSLPFAMEALPQVEGRRVFHDFNNTSMGWSIGAAIGIGLANPSRQLIVFAGDGSLTLGLSDLKSLSSIRPGVKFVLLDNQGHGMIQQTQDQWFDGHYIASSSPSSLHFPDWRLISKSAGWEYLPLETPDSTDTISYFLSSQVSTLLHLKIGSGWRARPQVKFGYPIEDQDPPLPRQKFFELMRVEPLAVSRHNRQA